MKKILALALAALMIASLAACSKDDGDVTDNANNETDVLAVEDMVYENLTYAIDNNNGLYMITGYKADDLDLVDITVPEKIDGRTVVGIADSAFKSSTVIRSITLPKTITYIGDHAFYDCDQLTKIELPDAVTTIGIGAFENCDNLETVKLSAELLTIQKSAFWNCVKLKDVTIPAKVTSIGDGAFWNCNALTAIVLPETLKTLGAAAFYQCDSLALATIPALEDIVELNEKGEEISRVSAIGEIAFSACSSALVITAPKDSAAEKYVLAAGITLAGVKDDAPAEDNETPEEDGETPGEGENTQS